MKLALSPSPSGNICKTSRKLEALRKSPSSVGDPSWEPIPKITAKNKITKSTNKAEQRSHHWRGSKQTKGGDKITTFTLQYKWLIQRVATGVLVSHSNLIFFYFCLTQKRLHRWLPSMHAEGAGGISHLPCSLQGFFFPHCEPHQIYRREQPPGDDSPVQTLRGEKNTFAAL